MATDIAAKTGKRINSLSFFNTSKHDFIILKVLETLLKKPP
jgi:hypothetical protein